MVTAVEVRIDLFWSGAFRFGRSVLVGHGLTCSGEFWRVMVGSGLAVLFGFDQVRYVQSWRSGFGMNWSVPVRRGKFS